MIRLLLLLVAVLGLAAAPAWGASRYEIVDDCADDGRLQGDYTLAELRDARRNLRTEVAEYTNCADVLRSAELRLMQADEPARTGSPGRPGSERPDAAAPLAPAGEDEQRALRRARTAAPEAVEVSGRTLVPRTAGFAPVTARNEMPSSLIALLVAMGLLGGGAYAARRTGSH